MTTPKLKQALKTLSTFHRPDGSPNVFLFSTPRSGSTWLMELIWSQPGFKYCNEPLNLHNTYVRKYLGINDWRELYNKGSTEALHRYFQSLCNGSLRFKNPNPFKRYYRPVTRRIVFKEIHGGGDRINWFRDTFNCRIVYLVRHPLAVTISTEEYRTLNASLDSDYARHFTPEQLEYARAVNRSGSNLERGVLAWSVQNMVPLKEATDDWALITYEQLVLDPDPLIAHLASKLELPKPERMRDRLAVPSGVKRKSTQETLQFLEQRDMRRRSWLVEKWRRKVNEAQERSAMAILERFGLDAYVAGSVLPARRLWISPAPPSSSEAAAPRPHLAGGTHSSPRHPPRRGA